MKRPIRPALPFVLLACLVAYLAVEAGGDGDGRQAGLISAIRASGGVIKGGEGPDASPLEVILFGAGVQAANIDRLAGLDRLGALQLSGSGVDDAALAHVWPLKGLERLDLEAARVTDRGLAGLAALPRLGSLRVTGAARVSGRGLGALAALPGLGTLDLSRCPIDDEGLLAIGGLRSLRELHLAQTAITDRGMAALAKLPDLRVLDLTNVRIGDAGLAHLAGLSRLEELHVWSDSVTDAGLATIGRLPSLTSLDLRCPKVTDDGIARLAPLGPRLTGLILHSDAATGAGLGPTPGPPVARGRGSTIRRRIARPISATSSNSGTSASRGRA